MNIFNKNYFLNLINNKFLKNKSAIKNKKYIYKNVRKGKASKTYCKRNSSKTS